MQLDVKTITLLMICTCLQAIDSTFNAPRPRYDRTHIIQHRSVSGLRRTRLRFCGRNPYQNYRHLCCDGMLWRRTRQRQQCCGRSIYSPYRQICCNKRLHPRTYGRNTECCGYLVYHRLLRGCCGGRVYNPFTRECCNPGARIVAKGACHLKRCGSKLYSPSTEICCANRFREAVYPKSYGTNSACCGSVMYNKKVRCCDHKKFIRPLAHCARLFCGKQPYNPATHKCCRNGMFVISRMLSCLRRMCGYRPFNPASQICCGRRIIYPRRQFSSCCGIKLYNVHTQHCLRPTLRIRNKNKPFRRQCGSLYYSPTMQTCCANGVLRSKRYGDTTACCADIVYNNATQKCCNNSVIVSKNLACSRCLTQYYDPTRFLCCGGTALWPRSSGQLTRCCGSITYNIKNQRCCIPDFVINLPSTCNNLMCGGSSFNPSTQVCCFNRVLLPRHYGANTECCGGTVYNKVTHQCCNGQSIVVKSFSCVPCSGRYFDPRVQICCKDSLVSPAYGSFSYCCGKTQINTNKSKCCEGGKAVLRSSSCPQPRCNNLPYDPKTSICCGGKALFQRTFGEDTECCNYKDMYSAYHVRLQKCCFGNALLFTEPCPPNRYQCTQNFDSTKYLCCNKRKILRKYGAKSACCGSFVINTAAEVCCNQVPAPNIVGAPVACCGQQSYNTDLAKCCPDNKVVPKCGTCGVTIIPLSTERIPTTFSTRPTTQSPSTAGTTQRYQYRPWWK